MEKAFYNPNLINKRKSAIHRVLVNSLGQVSDIDIYEKNQCIIGKVKLNDKYLFLKMKPLKKGLLEIENYRKVKRIYPTPELLYSIKSSKYCILLYDYEQSVDDTGGLLLDYLYHDKLNKKKLNAILDFYRISLKNKKDYFHIYPSEKYFKNRINKRIENGFLKDKRIKPFLKMNISVNGVRYQKNTKQIISDTVNYFKKRNRELCFLTQGDPLTINIGTKPVFFDFDTSGFNALAGEVAIFIWAVFLAEVYYYPKYNPKSYISRSVFLKEIMDNKPRVLKKISRKDNTLLLKLAYNLSKNRRYIIKRYIEIISKELTKKQRRDLNKSIKFFIAMRILATFDLKYYSSEDFLSSLAFLHIFCNSQMTKNLNKGFSLVNL